MARKRRQKRIIKPNLRRSSSSKVSKVQQNQLSISQKLIFTLILALLLGAGASLYLYLVGRKRIAAEPNFSPNTMPEESLLNLNYEPLKNDLLKSLTFGDNLRNYLLTASDYDEARQSLMSGLRYIEKEDRCLAESIQNLSAELLDIDILSFNTIYTFEADEKSINILNVGRRLKLNFFSFNNDWHEIGNLKHELTHLRLKDAWLVDLARLEHISTKDVWSITNFQYNALYLQDMQNIQKLVTEEIYKINELISLAEFDTQTKLNSLEKKISEKLLQKLENLKYYFLDRTDFDKSEIPLANPYSDNKELLKNKTPLTFNLDGVFYSIKVLQPEKIPGKITARYLAKSAIYWFKEIIHQRIIPYLTSPEVKDYFKVPYKKFPRRNIYIQSAKQKHALYLENIEETKKELATTVDKNTLWSISFFGKQHKAIDTSSQPGQKSNKTDETPSNNILFTEQEYIIITLTEELIANINSLSTEIQDALFPNSSKVIKRLLKCHETLPAWVKEDELEIVLSPKI